MAGPRGYHSYRGRSSKGKLVLAVLLVLVILASAGFMMMQKYIVCDETGTPKLVLPEKTEESQPPEEEEPVNITIQEQEKKSLLQAVELGDDPADWTAELAAASGQNAFCVTMKASGGQLRYPFENAAAVAGASVAGTASKAAEVLPSLLEGEWYTVARKIGRAHV